jgi:hypothetical protein
MLPLHFCIVSPTCHCVGMAPAHLHPHLPMAAATTQPLCFNATSCRQHCLFAASCLRKLWLMQRCQQACQI